MTESQFNLQIFFFFVSFFSVFRFTIKKRSVIQRGTNQTQNSIQFQKQPSVGILQDQPSIYVIKFHRKTPTIEPAFCKSCRLLASNFTLKRFFVNFRKFTERFSDRIIRPDDYRCNFELELVCKSKTKSLTDLENLFQLVLKTSVFKQS